MAEIPVGHGDRGLPGPVLIEPAALHDLFQSGRDPPVGQLPLSASGHSETGVPVGDDGHPPGGLVEGLTDLSCEIPPVLP